MDIMCVEAVFQNAQRYYFACFNEWLTKQNMDKPAGTSQWSERQIAKTRAKYALLGFGRPSPRSQRIAR